MFVEDVVASVAIKDFVSWCMFHITSYGSIQNFISLAKNDKGSTVYWNLQLVGGKRLECSLVKNLKRALFLRRISLSYTIRLFLCCLYRSSTAEVVGYKKESWPWLWNVRDYRHQVTDFPETYNEHSVGCHPTLIHFKTGIKNINVIIVWRLKLNFFSSYMVDIVTGGHSFKDVVVCAYGGL